MTLCPQLLRLSAEHARWLADLAGWASLGDEDRCSRLLALWDVAVLPHCRAEEDVLLPELARWLSETDASIVFTLGDHVALRRLARELREDIGSARWAALAAMERRLAEHAEFEERTLFPLLQETLGCDRIASLATHLDRRISTADRDERRHRPADGPPDAHAALDTRRGRKP